MDDSILVSVIITTYGSPIKLRRAIDSILEQTYKHIEVLIIDDNDSCSIEREKTESIMRHYCEDNRIIYIKHKENLNGAAARNTGLRKARGKYITFLDNDDVLLPNRIMKSVDFLENACGYEGVFAQVLIGSYGSFDDYVSMIDTENLQYGLLSGTKSIGTGSNLFFSKKAVQDIGFFDERFTRFQDIEYVIRFLDKYKAGMIEEILIIKDGDGRNVPSYKKMKKNDLMFLEKFDPVINSYDTNRVKCIYEYHAADLFRYAIECFGKKSDIEYEKTKLEKYRQLTTSELKKYRYYLVVRVIKKIKRWLRSSDLMKRFYCRVKSKKTDFSEYEKYKRYLSY